MRNYPELAIKQPWWFFKVWNKYNFQVNTVFHHFNVLFKTDAAQMLQRQQSTHINCYTEDVKVYNPQTPSSVQMAVKALTVRDNVKN